MIQSICIEYRPKGIPNQENTNEWELYKYVVIEKDECGPSEIGLLKSAFGNFFEFRVVVYITEPVTLKIYDMTLRDWKEI